MSQAEGPQQVFGGQPRSHEELDVGSHQLGGRQRAHAQDEGSSQHVIGERNVEGGDPHYILGGRLMSSNVGNWRTPAQSPPPQPPHTATRLERGKRGLSGFDVPRDTDALPVPAGPPTPLGPLGLQGDDAARRSAASTATGHSAPSEGDVGA
eukprot:4667984-Alexandrium_andersonii.AAC.1